MDNCQKECAKKDDGQYYDYCSRGHAYQHKTLMQPKWEKKPANTEPWKSSYYLKYHGGLINFIFAEDNRACFITLAHMGRGYST